MIDAKDLKVFVIESTLYAMETLWPGASNPAAVNLLLGTAFKESMIGGVMHLKQIGGTALGIYRIEPVDHHDIWDNYLATRPDKASFIRGLASQRMRTDQPFRDDLISNLKYQTAIAWIKYHRGRFRWPTIEDPGSGRRVINPNDIPALAKIWHDVYDANSDHGTVEQYIEAFPTL